jgi:tetratricopeptide (TPR) repeat protein
MFRYFYFLIFLQIFLSSCSEEKDSRSTIPQTVIGGYEPMLNVLNKAIEDDPDEAELYFKRARVYYNMYYWKKSLNDVQTAITLDNTPSHYYLLLAQNQYQLHNYVDAVKASEKCEAIGSNDVELPILQANIYFHIEDTSRMKTAMHKSEQLVPFHSDLALLKGKIAASNGDTSTALSYFRKAVTTHPRNLEALKGVLNVYHRRANDDSLMYYLMGVRTLADRDSELWYWEGCFYQRRHMPESAQRCFTTSLQLDSAFYPTYLSFGNLEYSRERFDAAIKQYLNYIRFDNENPFVYRRLIDLMAKTENEQATISYYEKLAELDSNNVQVRMALSRLYKQYNIEQPLPAPPVPVRRDTTTRRSVERDTVR